MNHHENAIFSVAYNILEDYIVIYAIIIIMSLLQQSAVISNLWGTKSFTNTLQHVTEIVDWLVCTLSSLNIQ